MKTGKSRSQENKWETILVSAPPPPKPSMKSSLKLWWSSRNLGKGDRGAKFLCKMLDIESWDSSGAQCWLEKANSHESRQESLLSHKLRKWPQTFTASLSGAVFGLAFSPLPLRVKQSECATASLSSHTQVYSQAIRTTPKSTFCFAEMC